MRSKIEGNVVFIWCPPGMIPMFELYDMEQDGTKRYTITLGYYPEDPLLSGGE
jgi:hypothetical protein